MTNAIICDLDGTLALFEGSNPFDRDFSQDKVNTPVLEILNRFKDDTNIIITSGRNDKFMYQSLNWLNDHFIPWNYLFMRPDGDFRKDVEFKREVYETKIQPKNFNILFCLDDRDQVVALWRELGLTCLQVAEGHF